MKFSLPTESFYKVLQIASKSLLSKANLPILSNLMITAMDGKIEVIATNLETATRVEVAAKVEESGRVTVSGKTLLEISSQLEGGELGVEKLGEELRVISGEFSARLTTISAEEFPAIPRVEKGIKIKIPIQEFFRMVNNVWFCASQDEGRPILTGVLMEGTKSKISMVATDGYRLSFDEVKTPNEQGIGFKIVIPARALSEVAKITQEVNGQDEQAAKDITMVLASDLNQVNFKIDNVEFTSRLIEGEFPNWQKTIPGNFDTKITLAKNELIRLVKLISVFARESGNIIKFQFNPGANGKAGSLRVFANAKEVGSSDGQMEAKVDGKGGEIAFNFRYLLEALATIEDEEVEFEMIESLNPGKLSPHKGEHKFFHIIMPVRLQV